jgi:fumarate hydratase class II
VEVSHDAPWGAYTERVLATYPQSGVELVPEVFLREYIKAKMVYASVNKKHKKIDAMTKKTIHDAGKKLLEMDSIGFMSYFPI